MSNPWSNQLVSLVVVTAPPGQYAGIFVYSPSPGLGNLIGSWAASAGVDPYGNAYPQGLNVTTGSITGVTFNGNNFQLNNSGMFLYSGTPALGNLIASITNNTGTDANGNAYLEGITSYAISPSPNQAVQTDLGTISWFNAPGPGGPWTQINDLTLASSPFTNLIIGQDLVIGTNLVVNQNIQATLVTATNPTTFVAETWHDFPAGINGWGNGTGGWKKFRLLPFGSVEISISLRLIGTKTDGTLILPAGALPAAYQPTSAKRMPCSTTNAANSANSTPWMGFLTDGSVNVSGVNTAGTLDHVDCHVVLSLIS